MSAPLHLTLLTTAIIGAAAAYAGIVRDESATEEDCQLTVPMQHRLRSIDEVSPITGFAIVAHHISDLDLYLKAVDDIAAFGANAVVIVTPMFQHDVSSHDIRFIRSKCPTDPQILAILNRAREHELFTALLPIVLLEHANPKEWRGVIEPDDWDAWWSSYEAFLNRYVALANAGGVDLLYVGSELNSTESSPRWESLITAVRAQYDGLIGYSSNWDRYDKVELWSLVDVMSVSAYFELHTELRQPDSETLADAWRSERDAMLTEARLREKPLVLSEIGYPTLSWATRYPWNYVPQEGMNADRQARAAQAGGFEAFFDVWAESLVDRQSNAKGFFCYHWDPYHDGQDYDTGYGLKGKPAYRVVKRGFANIRSATEQK